MDSNAQVQLHIEHKGKAKEEQTKFLAIDGGQMPPLPPEINPAHPLHHTITRRKFWYWDSLHDIVHHLQCIILTFPFT